MDSADSQFVYRQPAWGQGMVSEEDARFLHDLILETRPSVAVEVGVASGCSSIVMLDALRQTRTDAGEDEIWLYSFDVLDHCYFKPEKPIGAAVTELAPWLRPHQQFTLGNAFAAREVLAGRRVPFALIDAQHHHPWPTADLLALLPILEPRAWVALHDIRLPLVHRAIFYSFGPLNLFDMWPGEKRQGGTAGNMGAIQMPDDLTTVPAMLQPILQRPWEVALPQDVCDELGIIARPIDRREYQRPLYDRIVEATSHGRPVYVWGLSERSRTLATRLRARQVPIAGFVDERAQRTEGDAHHLSDEDAFVDGVAVVRPGELEPQASPRPYFAMAGMEGKVVATALSRKGWKRAADYVVL